MTGQAETTLNTVPDEELIAEILNGKKRLFEQLIRKYNQRLYRMGIAILGDEMETEDAMQMAYINAYEHLSKFEHRSSFGTWLTRIMINQCYQQKKKSKRFLANFTPTDNFITMDTPANELVNKELNTILEKAIAQLPERYRLVFVLREMEDLSVRETSTTLSITEPNVKVRLNRAKTMLRENLKGYMKDQVYNFHLSRCDQMVARVLTHLNIS